MHIRGVFMKIRVRFDGDTGKYYVQTRRGYWPFRVWITATKQNSDRWAKRTKVTREFDSFDKAHEYAVKMSVDFNYTQKKHKVPLV